MKISFTGDVFLGGDLQKKSAKKIIKVSSFNNADFRVVNLEHPISDNDIELDKCTLFTNSSATMKLREMGVNMVNLSNNHIQDKGNEGIVDTLENLKKFNIKYFGAGLNINEAKLNQKLDKDYCILGYCDYGKKYLNQIQIADKNTPGINPLNYQNIIDDLSNLEEGKKAILFFHWGREHVSLPKYEDILLAKDLLRNEKVAMIIGMHSHRFQGVVEFNGKKAYMSLGNFIFPNFHIKPPTKIYYPHKDFKCDYQTRQYHSVFKPTYKKWKNVNRKSIIVSFDTEVKELSHVFVYQEDNEVCIKEQKGIPQLLSKFKFKFLTFLYKLPKGIYIFLEKNNTLLSIILWRTQIMFFYLRQLGIKAFLKKVKKRL
ncbi:hypothetical protein KUL156_27120 [Alteromonas sp. KUL156]|nr:hypothetical protein KUL154_49600 [Alteromonas sp. KUL154]GFE00120.1 hypothetical protein KUL156_27120 [Alteromonas sp. KUL156]